MTSTARTEAEQCPPAMRPSNGGLTLSLQTEKNSKIIHRKRTVPNGQLRCKKEKNHLCKCDVSLFETNLAETLLAGNIKKPAF